jgi:hypothetical protein
MELQKATESSMNTTLRSTSGPESLEQTIAKLVALGAELGFSVDQLILLLRADMTIRELLKYLEARANQPK